MSSSNIKTATAESKFNWNDIVVGTLDHSEHFFEEKHSKHERLDVLQEMEMVDKLLTSAVLDDKITKDNENKENIMAIPQTITPQIKVELVEDVTKPSPPPPPIKVVSACVAENINMTAKPSKLLPNIAVQWSTQKRVITAAAATGAVVKSASTRSMQPPPHAYEFKDTYQRRKEEALRRRMQDERKMREFHSRPVPNFKSFEQRKTKVVHAVTVPITPQVLKKSRETEEKRKKKLEEWNNKQPLKFEPRPATVLNEVPFVPKKTVTVLQARPFKLNSERRLQERKQYDSAVQRSHEEKQKQEEEERKKREEEHVKELRKLTTFKARPNPFK